MKGRLDKVLATCTLISRTDAQSALRAGRVTVDGNAVRDGKVKVDSDVQDIRLDGKPVGGDGFVYLMLYKPVGVLSATEDKKGAVTAMDLLPEEYRKAAPGVVGRLDKDAEGLLLLTSNGELNHRLTSPKRHADKLYRVTLDIAGAMLMDALTSGRGLDTLRKMIIAQGGDASCCDDVANLPQAKVILPVPALTDGYIHHMDTVGLGNTAQLMGAGRRTKEDVIDPSVGFVLHKRISEKVIKGEAIATVYARDEQSAHAAINAIQNQIFITDEQVSACKLIHAFVTDTEIEKL